MLSMKAIIFVADNQNAGKTLIDIFPKFEKIHGLHGNNT